MEQDSGKENKTNSSRSNPNQQQASAATGVGNGVINSTTAGTSTVPLSDRSTSTKSEGLNNINNSGGSGNNSDNSTGIVSLGINSFGFNFDAEDGMINSLQESNTSNNMSGKTEEAKSGVPQKQNQQQQQNNIFTVAAMKTDEGSHAEAAAAAVANLQSIASAFTMDNQDHGGNSSLADAVGSGPQHTVEDAASLAGDSTASTPAVVSVSTMGSGQTDLSRSSSQRFDADQRPKKKSKKLDDSKREERNAREKERSFRISRQINELRNLLSSGGVIVPKGTKSSVLTEAANYIRMLQQHQYRSEIDRHQLVQQMQMIGGGALGEPAASAIRHVAAQNGVWSLGNFGGVPPKSAMSYYQGAVTGAAAAAQPEIAPSSDPNAPLPTKIEDPEYRFIFNSCSVGMAIASMGGAFIDCNQLFCQLSNYSKQEVCSMTIFNLTSRQDLQHAFDLISQMISPPVDGRNQGNPKPCVLRGSMKNRDDLGLSVALIKGDDGIAKCFCVTLIRNPASPFDPSRPVPATADLIQRAIAPQVLQQQQQPLTVTPQPQQQLQPQQQQQIQVQVQQQQPQLQVQQQPQAQLLTQQQQQQTQLLTQQQQQQQTQLQTQTLLLQQQQKHPATTSKEVGTGNLDSSPAYTSG